MAAELHVGLYGELDMNLIDGSSVWLQSAAIVCASVPGARVTLVLRGAERRRTLTGALHDHPSIGVVSPAEDVPRMPPADVVARLEQIDRGQPFDLIVIRGKEVAEGAARGPLAGRLWIYHVPTPDRQKDVDHLSVLRPGCARILCQTPEVRTHLARLAPELEDKLALLPPMVPPPAHEPDFDRSRVSQLVYAGKIAPEYCFLETVEAFRRFRALHPGATLFVAGDKIHDPPAEPEFKALATEVLANESGLEHLGGLPREEVGALLRRCDVALSLRRPELEKSLELSTKVLEYGAAGCAVILNPAPQYERLLGPDYPLFASDVVGAVQALESASSSPAVRRAAAQSCFEASRSYWYDAVAQSLEREIRRGPVVIREPRRILVAGHQLSFARPLAERWREFGADVREDVWLRHAEHDDVRSRELLDWADTVICEWCLGNAAWYSQVAEGHKRIVVRFHRSELETRFPATVVADRVDRFVFVAEHVRQRALERYGWDPRRATVIPNGIKLGSLARAKLPGAWLNLGLVGFVPRLKRPDRAMEILERLRIREPAFRLLVKGRPPWEYAWMLKRDEERLYYERLYERWQGAPLLREAVEREAHGENLADFFQKVGFVLSTSEVEGHQVALAEAMASGAVPVVLDRSGAAAQYAEEWVHGSVAGAADAILELHRARAARREGERAAEFARQWDLERVARDWAALLNLDAASVPAATGTRP